jgi:hypothetical protein
VEAALKPTTKCLFTVLNGLATIRRHTQEDVERNSFDPLTLTEVSDCTSIATPAEIVLRERSFVPTELVLMFRLSGLEVLQIWGGTAGNWGRRKIDLDEMEIMVLAQKPAG